MSILKIQISLTATNVKTNFNTHLRHFTPTEQRIYM